jgi:hypothetical protein
VLFFRGAVPSALREVLALVAISSEAVDRAIGDQDDAAAAAAVAAIGSAACHELFPVKADQPVSTITAADMKVCDIYQSCAPL